jgi:TetR/AcrR family transcriptional regulator
MKRAKPARRGATRERILAAAVREFSRHGYRGGRVQRITKAARANPRMIYHYFGGKEGLYLASLEHVYTDVRRAEQALELRALPPVEGMRRFIDFTFDHFARHTEFIGMLVSENLALAKYLRRSRVVPKLTPPLLATIRDLLERGRHDKVFRADVDPVQLFVTIHAVCYLHVANRHTLSAMFQMDLADAQWLAARRRHVRDVILAYLGAAESPGAADTPPERRSRLLQEPA